MARYADQPVTEPIDNCRPEGSPYDLSRRTVRDLTLAAVAGVGMVAMLGATGYDAAGAVDLHGMSDDHKLLVVEAGLVAVALLLSLVTLRYWYKTRPDRSSAPKAAGSGRRSRKDTSTPGRRARGADEAAPPLHLDDDAPLFMPTGEVPAVTASVADPGPDAGPGVDADHSGADEDWAPATGELPQVESAGPRVARPSAQARADALAKPATDVDDQNL